MINQLLQVGAFMSRFGQDVPSSPVDEIDIGTARSRTQLAQNGLNDLFSALTASPTDGMMRVNQAKALKALSDQLYVLLGTAHSLGLGMLLPVAFRVVHEANMSKLWTEQEIAQVPAGYATEERPTGGDRRFLVTDPFGKIVKSPSYREANLHDLLDELAGQELLDYNHASNLIFGDEPEPDIDYDSSEEE